ncbi:MAG: hypothetical protein KDC92_15990 [Bacteroidetes bacterium]|nr:hypothetical protein [Bacteroidota bacterium]
MKLRIVLATAIGVCFILTSCEKKSDQLKREVLAIHDELMPDWPRLDKMRIEIGDMADSNHLATRSKEILDVKTQLKQAYDFMDDWMTNFQAPDKTVDESIKVAFYQEQLLLLDSMRSVMNKAKSSGVLMIESLK